jgi:GTP-binding protein LepA
VAYKIPKPVRKEEKSQPSEDQKYIIIENPHDLPNDIKEIWEPMIKLEIITPILYLGNILQLKDMYRWDNIETKNIGGEKILIIAKMPLAELISDFDSQLKSISTGFASYSYELMDFERADLTKLEILVAGEPVAGLVRVIPKKRSSHEGRKMVEKLKDLLPRQQFTQALQAVCEGKIIARETIPAIKKDVTGYLYGGDRTRKMKLWKKQKKGKKKLQERVSGVKIPVKIFKDLLR